MIRVVEMLLTNVIKIIDLGLKLSWYPRGEILWSIEIYFRTDLRF